MISETKFIKSTVALHLSLVCAFLVFFKNNIQIDVCLNVCQHFSVPFLAFNILIFKFQIRIKSHQLIKKSELNSSIEIEMDSNIESQQKIVEVWLKNYHSAANPWKLGVVENVGRGLIATRDIGVNELILCEPPLIVGLVGHEKDDRVCTICYKLISENDLCSRCSLPVCENCLTNCRHVECNFLQSLNLNVKERSVQIIRSLPAIRGLYLSEIENNALNILQCNRTIDIEKMIDDLLKEANGSNISVRDELVNVASVLNTNAFQIVVASMGLNLRGLYPLMSLINHNCAANARYFTDNNFVTSLFARKPIKMGEEISISYAKILWSTPSRQSYLKITKQFTCKCDRCTDPTEGQTFLSALKCFDRASCSGLVLPIDPLNFTSAWKCHTCSRSSDFKIVLRSQEVVSCMIKGISSKNSIPEIDDFLNRRLLKVLPASNQFVVEMKMKIIAVDVNGKWCGNTFFLVKIKV